MKIKNKTCYNCLIINAGFDFQKSEQEFIKEEIKPLDNFFKSKGILKNIDTSNISEEELYFQED